MPRLQQGKPVFKKGGKNSDVNSRMSPKEKRQGVLEGDTNFDQILPAILSYPEPRNIS